MIFKICLISFLVISAITFILYAEDKRRAKRDEWRISESTLLFASLLGGAVGGFSAMMLLRHKTKHWYFRAINILGIIWQIGLLVMLGIMKL